MSARSAAAHEELGKLLRDKQDFPINYNHYYTDTIAAKLRERLRKQVLASLPAKSDAAAYKQVKQAFDKWGNSASADMGEVAAEEALDCLMAIYKVRTHKDMFSGDIWRV